MITHATIWDHANGDSSITLHTQDGEEFSFDEVASSRVESAILRVLVDKAIRVEQIECDHPMVVDAYILHFA